MDPQQTGCSSARAPGPACLGDWQLVWRNSDPSVAAEPLHLPASAFCCFSIFSRRPSKESILVLIWVNSFLMVCNSSDFTGKGGKGQKATESQRLHDSLRTHLTATPCFPKTAPDHVGCSEALRPSRDPGLRHDGARYRCSPVGEHLISCLFTEGYEKG